MTAPAIPLLLCPECGTQLGTDLLSCPLCRRLVHAERLEAIAEQARLAAERGESVEALSLWREALTLLPPGSRQYELVSERASKLSSQVGNTSKDSSDVQRDKGFRSGSVVATIGALLLFIVTKGKLLLGGLTKAGTFWTMLLSVAVYWQMWGWTFALGLVVSIYIHEMGHVDMLRRYGFAATAPMFVPGLGAFVRMRQHPVNTVEDARIGLAGPIWGTATALVCYGLYRATGHGIWAALAHVGAIINVFNLVPIGPLDGGRGMRALSRGQAWLLVLVIGIVWYLTGEALLLLVGIVAAIRAAAKAPEDSPDTMTLVQFAVLVGLLAPLCTIKVPGAHLAGDDEGTPTELGPTPRIEGSVRVNGMPVADAEVTVSGRRRFRLRTDSNGEFRSKRISRMKYVNVEIQGEVELPGGTLVRRQLYDDSMELKPAEVARIDLELASIVVEVRDKVTGSAIAGANVHVRGVGVNETTDADGRATICIDVKVGASFHVHAKGQKSQTVPLGSQIERPSGALVVELLRSVPCQGRVTIVGGAVEGSEELGSFIWAKHRTSDVGSIGPVVAGDDYTFVLDGLGPGIYEAIIHLRGVYGEPVEFELGPAGASDLVLEFRPKSQEHDD